MGLALIGLFVYWESVSLDPLMPTHIWKDRDFSLLMAILVLGFTGFSSSAFWISVYMQRVKQYSALEVAVHLLPMAIMGVVVNIISALIMHRISNKLLMLIASTSYTVAFLLLAVQKQDSSYWAFIFPSLILTVVGADLEFTVANMYVMSSLPRHQQSSKPLLAFRVSLIHQFQLLAGFSIQQQSFARLWRLVQLPRFSTRPQTKAKV